MKVMLKLPVSLHQLVAERAMAEGVTTEEFVLCILSEAVGQGETLRKAEKKFEKALKKVKKQVKRTGGKIRAS